MRRLSLLLCLALPLLTAAVPATPVAPSSPAVVAPRADFDPVGRYAFTTPVGGENAEFDMVIERRPDGALGGMVRNPNFGDIPITSARVEGRTVRGTLATPQGEATMEFVVAEDNSIEGQWSMAGDGARLTGKKVA